MKNKKTIMVWSLVIVSLLAAGLLLFRALNPGPVQDDGQEFRTWLWEQRSADLIVQVLLVFAGALGVTAILPFEDRDV